MTKNVRLYFSIEERVQSGKTKSDSFPYRGCWQDSNALLSEVGALLAGAEQLSQQSIAALSARAGVKLTQWTLSLNLGSLIFSEADWFLSTSGRYPRHWDLWWNCRLPPGGKAGHSVDFPPW